LLLNAVGPQTRHAGQVRLIVKPREPVKSALEGIAEFFGWLKQITEQLAQPERRALILRDALRKFLRGRKLQPPCCRLETLAWIEILSSPRGAGGCKCGF